MTEKPETEIEAVEEEITSEMTARNPLETEVDIFAIKLDTRCKSKV